MNFRPRLNDEQRAAARRRWEGCPNERFGWLAAECAAAWGVSITRQALRKAAIKAGWAKGGPPSEPLAILPEHERVKPNAPEPQAVAEPNLAAMPYGPPAAHYMLNRLATLSARVRAMAQQANDLASAIDDAALEVALCIAMVGADGQKLARLRDLLKHAES